MSKLYSTKLSSGDRGWCIKVALSNVRALGLSDGPMTAKGRIDHDESGEVVISSKSLQG